ncbi:LysR family transcriptional regulator [Luteimonas sp. XNQY3]|nr:LysR family transcriptional regulator [Luteimonas sp. XNQY3]MCD9008072.1 LysR family transcriptional regulator [Luteimonas sp. XNQY3]
MNTHFPSSAHNVHQSAEGTDMQIRYLRYFLIVAEEQSFTRAAARAHIEPSPLSRAIKELERQLGVTLFHRGRGRIKLTWPGEVFLEEVRRILAFLEDAKTRVLSASRGYRGRIRIGLADALAQPQLTRLLARCREEEPLTEIRVAEMTAHEMVQALGNDQIDVGFTVDGLIAEGYHMERVWRDRLAVTIPTHHPLLSQGRVSVTDVLRYPLIMCHPERCASGYNVVRRWIMTASSSASETVAEYVSGHEPMMMLVAAGYGIGIGLESQCALYTHPDVIVRQVSDDAPDMITFAVSAERPTPELARFVQRAKLVGAMGVSEEDRSRMLVK